MPFGKFRAQQMCRIPSQAGIQAGQSGAAAAAGNKTGQGRMSKHVYQSQKVMYQVQKQK
jgi:hypothetical protein